MHPLAQSLLRRLAAALAPCAMSLLVLARPAVASAQPVALDASAACVPGATCDALRFSLLLPGAAPMPLSIATLRFTLLSPGWRFVGGPTVAFVAEDALGFGPFGGTAELSDAGGAAAVGTDAFLDLLGQGSSFELFPGAGGYVQLAVTAGTAPIAFRFDGTDFAGTAFGGTVGAPVPGVVPEPTSLLLVAGGVAVLLAGSARRRRAA